MLALQIIVVGVGVIGDSKFIIVYVDFKSYHECDNVVIGKIIWIVDRTIIYYILTCHTNVWLWYSIDNVPVTFSL